jgi:hypothetical protein
MPHWRHQGKSFPYPIGRDEEYARFAADHREQERPFRALYGRPAHDALVLRKTEHRERVKALRKWARHRPKFGPRAMTEEEMATHMEELLLSAAPASELTEPERVREYFLVTTIREKPVKFVRITFHVA